MQYQVIDGTIHHNVHQPSRICSCRMWDILQISCPHACSILGKKNCSTQDYVLPYYLNSKLSSTYKYFIHLLVDPRGWHIPEHVSSVNIFPSNVKRLVGKPKKLRIPYLKSLRIM